MTHHLQRDLKGFVDEMNRDEEKEAQKTKMNHGILSWIAEVDCDIIYKNRKDWGREQELRGLFWINMTCAQDLELEKLDIEAWISGERNWKCRIWSYWNEQAHLWDGPGWNSRECSHWELVEGKRSWRRRRKRGFWIKRKPQECGITQRVYPVLSTYFACTTTKSGTFQIAGDTVVSKTDKSLGS